MGDGVPLVADLGRDLIEAVPTLRDPLVSSVAEVVAEHPQRQVISPDRRRGTPKFSRHQPDGEVLDVTRTPRPRIRLGELREPAQQRRAWRRSCRPRAVRDRCWLDHPANIAVEDRRLFVEMETPSTRASRADPGISVNVVLCLSPVESTLSSLTLPSPRTSWLHHIAPIARSHPIRPQRKSHVSLLPSICGPSPSNATRVKQN